MMWAKLVNTETTEWLYYTDDKNKRFILYSFVGAGTQASAVLSVQAKSNMWSACAQKLPSHGHWEHPLNLIIKHDDPPTRTMHRHVRHQLLAVCINWFTLWIQQSIWQWIWSTITQYLIHWNNIIFGIWVMPDWSSLVLHALIQIC